MYSFLVYICTNREQSSSTNQKVYDFLDELGDRNTRYSANLDCLLYCYEFDSINAADKLLSDLAKVKEWLGDACEEIKVFCVTNTLSL